MGAGLSDSMFRELADNAPVMIWRSGVDKLCDWFNKPWLDFTGRTMEQEVGYGWADGVHPEDLSRCVAIYESSFDARQPFSMTYRLRRHDGEYRWVLDNGAPYTREEEFAGYFGSCVDVTDQREALDRLNAAIEQRDATISEVYHRVKNNLQQVEGLIAVESATLSDPAAASSLRAVSGRVHAMGAVHKMLMKSQSLTRIRSDAFLGDLCADIALATGAEARGIAIGVEADPRDLDVDRAIALGLVVNELVTNSLKHAFPDGRAGRIRVRFGHIGADCTVLEVSDDGVGIPAGAADPDSRRSGFRLVRGFAGQLGARLVVDPGPGTVVRIVLP